MKTKLLLFSLLFTLTLWTKPLHGQCDAEFTVAPLEFCTELDTMHVVNLSTGTDLTYLWEFNGQVYTDFEPKIVGYNIGTYWIYLTVTNGVCEDTDSLEIDINPTPVCDLGNDTTICDGNTLELFGGLGANYYWLPGGEWEESLIVSTPGTYILILDNGICENSDTIVISTGTSPIIILPNDTTICFGESIVLDAGPAENHLWSTGATSQTIEVFDAGTYSVTGHNGDCSASDEIIISVDPIIELNLGNDTTLCVDESIVLDAGAADSCLWNTGSTEQLLEVFDAGTYSVTKYIGNCSVTDEINITIDAIPQPNLGNDIEACGDTTLSILNGPYESQVWSTGETFENIIVNTSGEYSVVTNNVNNCPGFDTIQVICNPFAVLSLAPDTTTVDGTTIALTPNSVVGVEPLSDASGIEFMTTKESSVTNDFTLATIIKPSAESFDYYGGLLSRGNGSQVDQMDFIWFLKPDHTFELQLRNETDAIVLTSTSTLDIGVNYVLTATVSSTEGVKLYANSIEIASTAETIAISDNNGSLNILRSFNEQYNPTLGHCSAKNAIFTGSFIWNSVLSQTEITDWQNNTSIVPQAENLALELWFKDNKGNRVVNNIDGSTGYVYDLKKWKANFPFNDHHNPYASISWSTGSNDYGLDFLAETTTKIYLTVSNEFNCYTTDSIEIIVEDSVTTNPNHVDIHYQDGTPVNGGFVKLWKVNDQGPNEIIGLFDIINGLVSFGDLDAGAYALHLIGITGYNSFFYEAANNIQGADLIVLNNGDYINLSILIPVDPPNKNNQNKEVNFIKEVTGTVSGYLTYASNNKGAGVHKSGPPKEGDPIPYEVVEVNILATTPLSWSDPLTLYQTFMAGISDENGYFEISGIPLGEHTVYPNLSAYDTIDVEPYYVELTEENPVIEDLNYEVDSTTGTGNGTTDIYANEVVNNDISVYPNPARHYIIIDLANNQNAEIRLYNMMGKTIYQETIYKQKQINLSSQPRGVYLLQIITNNGTHSRKIILE